MSDYFDQFNRQAAAAVQRNAHAPWYRRARRVRHSRALLGILAVLVVAAPAAGAVSNWFGLGAPDHLAVPSPTQFAGAVLPGTSQLTALRVADPQGGPPWGLRIVRTTRGDTCVQLGRVDHGKLGSLGIDGAWHDDGLFHAFPSSSVGDDCGVTDAEGHGFVNSVITGQVANANPLLAGMSSCRAPVYATAVGRAQDRQTGTCPPESVRFIFFGLLGPDARSVTYETPSGRLASEPTSGPQGAYLLVFTMDQRTCDLYTQGQFGGYGPCGNVWQSGQSSPSNIGAIKSVSYASGTVCRLTLPARDVSAQRALSQRLGREGVGAAQARRLLAALSAREHLPALEAGGPTCPPVGYVAARPAPVTSAEVRALLKVTIHRASRWCDRNGNYRANSFDEIPCDGAVPAGYSRMWMRARGQPAPGILIDVSTTARVPVTSSASWYAVDITNPPADSLRQGCGSGSSGTLGFGDIRAGQVLRTQDWEQVGQCPGIYRGVISYVQSSGPDEQGPGNGGGPRGALGQAIVGRFSFRVP